MKDILNLQQKIILFQTNIVILIMVFMTIHLFNETKIGLDKPIFIFLFVLYLFNFIAYRKDYFQKIRLYMVIKTIQVLLLSYMSFNTDRMVQYIGLFSLFMTFMELYVSLPDKKEYKRFIITLQLIAIILFGGIGVGINFLNLNALFLLLYGALLSYGFYSLFFEKNHELTSIISVQTRLFEEAEQTNDELRFSQNKFKLIHDEMAKQKYELEIANKRLNKMTAEIYTQNELLRYISSVLDIKELLDLVTDAIIGTIGVDTCSLVLFDERIEEYLYSVKSNYPGEHIEKLNEDVQKGYLQKYFESGKIHLNNRVVHKNYLFIEERPVGSIAIIPLLRDELTYGLLIAEHTAVDMFTENNVQFFRGIATQITIAINNANIYALMEEMAVKDGLTGIYNRKYLQDHIDDILMSVNKKKKPLSVALFDIDRFKSVNDKYGHLFGDEAIKMVAFMTLKQAKKHEGLAVRYGGEEFVLVLPNKTLDQAVEIIKELHEDIQTEKLNYEDQDVFINVSIGVTSYPQIAINGEQLLLRADNAMYFAKQNGRGQMIIDSKDLEKVV